MNGTQVYAKAYPGRRLLEVLEGVGPAGIVASICPKNVDPQGEMRTDPYYGYNPVVSALAARIRQITVPR